VAGADVYEVGEHVGLAVTFGTPDAPVDPAQVVVRLMDPAGGTAELAYGMDPAVTRTAPGQYQVVVAATLPGRWRYRFVGTGRDRGAFDGYFDVFDLSTTE
jgi:hypothetical protein